MSDFAAPLSSRELPIMDGPMEVAVRDSFEDVYHREYASLVRLALAMVDTPHQAEEVVQDAFAALYLKFAVVMNPVAYVRAAVLNGGRRVLRRRMLLRRQPQPAGGFGELGYNHVVDAVRRLPARQRAVILLRYDMQLTDSEIAETLRLPIGTVKSTLHRAIARLREEIIE
jgi:DNA-directed RNA polymerase specialized sigma24 family protein